MLRIIHPGHLSVPSRCDFFYCSGITLQDGLGKGMARPESSSHAGTSESQLKDAENGEEG